MWVFASTRVCLEVPAVLRGTLSLTVVYDPPPDDYKRQVALEGKESAAVMIASPTSKAPVNMGAVQVGWVGWGGFVSHYGGIDIRLTPQSVLCDHS